MNADMQPDEKTKKIAYEAGILEGIESLLRGLTLRERNEFTAGRLADVLLGIINESRRRCCE